MLRRRDVGDVGTGGAEAGGGHPGDDTSRHEPGDVRSERHHDVVEAQSEVGQQNDRSPTEPIGQGTLDRRAKELHECPGRPHQPIEDRCLGRIAGEKFLDEFRQHRNDDAERQHVEEHGDKNEEHRGLARRGRSRRVVYHRGLLARIIHDS